MQTIIRDAEAKLVETANVLRNDSVGWRAMHYHFSQLGEHYRSEYQTKIALNLINDFLKDDEGTMFACVDGDIFVVCRGVGKPKLDKVSFQLRYLFMDDPLSYNADGQENTGFCTTYDLSIGWEEFFYAAKRKVAVAAKFETEQRKKKETKVEPLSPGKLSAMEKDLAKADLSRVMRRQAICAALKGGREIKPVFEELYINIANLRQIVMPDVDLLSNRWLFNYLTQVLDIKMLDLLMSRPSLYLTGPISLNLNVPTLLSSKFTEFHEAVKTTQKISIVIEIQIADVFADMGAFMAAREAVQQLGYRVCLDGLTYLSFTQVDRERLGFDLAKLHWTPDLQGERGKDETRKLAKAIQQAGAHRVILCRCDDQNAVDWGQGLGVALFQGRHLDKQLNPGQKVVN